MFSGGALSTSRLNVEENINPFSSVMEQFYTAWFLLQGNAILRSFVIWSLTAIHSFIRTLINNYSE